MYNKITIRPYVEKGVFNLGLEQYNQSIFDGTKHELELVCLEEGSSIRFLTGLNPTASELNKLTKEEREAKIQEIKKTVIELEVAFGGKMVNPDDDQWWNKIEILKPTNLAFWSSYDMKLSLNNEPTYLNPTQNKLDLLKYFAIKAGGYPEIALSYGEARDRIVAPKFYLDEAENTISIQVEVSKLRNAAGAELQKLFEKNTNKLMYVCKVIDPNSVQYKKSTPVDVFYQNMDRYINGETVDKDKKKTAQMFLDVSKLDPETLKLRALVKDATYLKKLALKGDGMIYHMDSGQALGKTPAQVVEYLKNPLNEEIFKTLLSEVEKTWAS